VARVVVIPCAAIIWRRPRNRSENEKQNIRKIKIKKWYKGCFIENAGLSGRQWKRSDRDRGTLPGYGNEVHVGPALHTLLTRRAYVVPAGWWPEYLPYCSWGQSRYCTRHFLTDFFRETVISRTGLPGRVILLRWTSFFGAASRLMSTKSNHEPLNNLWVEIRRVVGELDQNRSVADVIFHTWIGVCLYNIFVRNNFL